MQCEIIVSNQCHRDNFWTIHILYVPKYTTYQWTSYLQGIGETMLSLQPKKHCSLQQGVQWPSPMSANMAPWSSQTCAYPHLATTSWSCSSDLKVSPSSPPGMVSWPQGKIQCHTKVQCDLWYCMFLLDLQRYQFTQHPLPHGSNRMQKSS